MKPTNKARSLLAVAGELSGDRLCAPILRELHRQFDAIETWGMGGPLSEQAGLRSVFDARSLSVMGIGDALRAASQARDALSALLRSIYSKPPSIALLINFTEFNTYLGRLLKKAGTRVLWVAAPQVWAWRESRLHSMGSSLDRMALLFPFEEALWRGAGVDARYVGHPALELPQRPREEIENSIGLKANEKRIAILAGSRAGEIQRLAQPLCEAAKKLCQMSAADRAYLIAAPHLREEQNFQLHKIANQFHIPVLCADPLHGAAPLLRAFDLALCASGTASLETALAGIPQVVAYRIDRLSAAIARRYLRTPFISLPNILMGEACVSELLQEDVQCDKIVNEGQKALAAPEKALALERSLRALMHIDGQRNFGSRVLDRMQDWLL